MKNIGGQAVIEGVMMKSLSCWTVAVRDQKGEIHIKKEVLERLPKFLRLPLVRGVVGLFHALAIGIKAIEFSASKAYTGEDEKPLSPFTMASTIIFAMGIGIGLFIFLPLYLTKLMGLVMSGVAKSSFIFNLTDGIIRVLIFLLYVFAIGLWKDMRRIFEYHGAEHKVIHAYEAGRDLSVESVRAFSPHHPRCGTSFLLIVMVISILVFSFVPQTWPFWGKFVSRLILIPLIAGISYELLRLSAKMKENSLIHLMILPGLLLQKLTTREPDDSQIEVAIRAVKEVLLLEEKDAREA
ncbi:MAG: DUF1385 domain-containing protein [Nitrospirae bacterium]|nr:DUF1385 domain-containing protein [Nitrospirota bacterium]MCL5421572.1 DUF1385 domain-containing protein [Nitrospirota bacterium]